MSNEAIDAYLDELLAPAASEDYSAPAPAIPPVTAAAASPAPAVRAPAIPAGHGTFPPPAAGTVQPPPRPAPAEAAAPALHSMAAPADLPPPAMPTAAAAPHRGIEVEAARPPAVHSAGRWLRMAVGRDHYAFELLRVQEVVRVVPVLAMRGAAPAVLGVMNLRGRIVPVFDLGRWLGGDCLDADEHARIVVVEREDELIGVLVTTVEDVVTLAREHVEPPLANGDPGAILGIARAGNAPTVLLDADALFG